MKVMQILPRMEVGGVERGVVDLAKYFKDKATQIVVVSGGGRLVAELERLGVKHYKLNVYKKSLTSFLLIKKLRKIIKEEKVDIVHARSRVPGWISFFATRNSDTHFLTTAHGAYSKHIFSEVMGWGKFVICPSQMIARYMMDTFGISSHKIRLVFRWVDREKFKFKSDSWQGDRLSVVSIGRISPSKGYEYLIEAFKKVVRRNPYFKLKIVGEASPSHEKYFNYLQTLVKRFSLNFNVEFLGYQRDVEGILKDANILVLPSIIPESFGRVIVEAFACGVPVIATKVGAVPEIVENEVDGILVPPYDAERIAEAILRLSRDQNFARRIAINARKKVEEKYSLEKCASQIEGVYAETMKHLRVLIIKISSLGDIVLSLPSLKAVREAFPKAEIFLLTGKRFLSLFRHCPYINRVIGVEENYKGIKKILKITNNLRKISFDYIIDLQNNQASHLIAFLSFPRKSFGYARKLGFLLTNRIKFFKGREIDPLSSQEEVLKLLGVRIREKKLIFWDTPKVNFDKWYKLGINTENIIGINISASRKWQSKNWPVSNIVKFIEIVYQRLSHFKIVLVGDKNSKDLAEEIMRSLRRKPINLCGKTDLAELIELLKIVKVFITPDTANLHLAQSLGKEVIGLFGPTNPRRHTVAAENLHIIFKKISCSFCYNPYCKENLCMKKITPQMVFKQVNKILK